jgi:hypothetical protein
MPILTPSRVLAAYPRFRPISSLPTPILYRLCASLGFIEGRWLDHRLHQERLETILPVIERFGTSYFGGIDCNTLALRAAYYAFCQRKPELLLLLLLLLRDPRRVLPLVSGAGFDEARRQLDDGGGVLAILNIGPYGILPGVLATLGWPISGTAASDELGVVRDFGTNLFPGLWEGAGAFPVEDSMVLLRTAHEIRKGRVVCIYPEFPLAARVPTADVRLFDHTVKASLGAASLATRMRVPVLPTALASLGGARFELLVGRRLMPASAGREEAHRITREIFVDIERIVRRFPEQWRGWEHYAEYPGHGPLGPGSSRTQ